MNLFCYIAVDQPMIFSTKEPFRREKIALNLEFEPGVSTEAKSIFILCFKCFDKIRCNRPYSAKVSLKNSTLFIYNIERTALIHPIACNIVLTPWTQSVHIVQST